MDLIPYENPSEAQEPHQTTFGDCEVGTIEKSSSNTNSTNPNIVVQNGKPLAGIVAIETLDDVIIQKSSQSTKDDVGRAVIQLIPNNMSMTVENSNQNLVGELDVQNSDAVSGQMSFQDSTHIRKSSEASRLVLNLIQPYTGESQILLQFSI